MMLQLKTENLKLKIYTARFFLLFASYCLAFTYVSAQSVSASLDRDKILLGEQVTLEFDINNINEGLYFVSKWPHLNDTINHSEIIKHTSIDTVNVNGYNTYRQSFIITSFDSGRWQLGPFIFELQNKISNKKIQLKTDSLYITVLPVDVSSMKDYHPLKDIIPVKQTFNWMPWLIAITLILLAGIIIFFIKKNKKTTATISKPVVKGTALERALEQLNKLEKEPLTSFIQIKSFHSETDLVIRRYFEEVMRINALQLTATELFYRLNVYMQQPQLRSKFQEMFEINQSVKFAKYAPSEDESRNMLREIIKGLYQIDELVNIAKNNAERLVSKY